MSALAEKINSLVAVEIEEGRMLQEANEGLKTALAAATEKIAALETTAAAVPELQAQLEGLKGDIAAADLAADTIANINPTPVSDGVIEAVVEDPSIETPPTVEEAPLPAPDTIPDLVVVESAVDALDQG